MIMICHWIRQCDDLQFRLYGQEIVCLEQKSRPGDKSRIWNVGLSLVSTTFWSANRRACLYLLFLWCYYERMANHGAILVWSSVLAGAQLRRDVIWYYWVVFTYKGMTSLTTYMMSWIVWFEDILEKLRLLREWEQDRFDWFWQMWNIQSERFSGKFR